MNAKLFKVAILSLTAVLVTGCGQRAHQDIAMTNHQQAKAQLPHDRAGVMPRWIDTDGERRFVFNPQKLAWGAYDASGYLVRYGRASGGKRWCANIGRPCLTTPGKFEIYRKGSAQCKSSKYPLPNGGAPMPHCMFFNGGIAIHGSNDIPDRHASHGCVRIKPHDAKWLHANFLDIGTDVHVLPYEES